jgi:hypothetical protein
MDLFRYTRGEERAFLDTGFEPDGDGYLFYRHHWARGIPVSAAEREAYLRPPLDGSRRAFHDAIRGRPATAPRRPYRRSYGRMLAGVPASFGWGLVLVGAMLLWRGAAIGIAAIQWLCLVAGYGDGVRDASRGRAPAAGPIRARRRNPFIPAQMKGKGIVSPGRTT